MPRSLRSRHVIALTNVSAITYLHSPSVAARAWWLCVGYIILTCYIIYLIFICYYYLVLFLNVYYLIYYLLINKVINLILLVVKFLINI